MADDQPETSPDGERDADGTASAPHATGTIAGDDRPDGVDRFGGMDPRMLELLVCPLTKTHLHYDHASNELVSEAAGLAFPVRGGVPILLPSEARPLCDDIAPGGS